MNEHIKDIAREAGFYFYTKEEDESQPIDWSCDYSDELDKFYNIAITEERIRAVKIVLKILESMHNCSNGSHNYYKHVSKMIEADFNVKL
jgi:hypothetical protein